MAPTFEQAEQFFMEMSREMRDMGFFIMDNYVNDWNGLLTIDEIRDNEVEAQTDSEDEDSS